MKRIEISTDSNQMRLWQKYWQCIKSHFQYKLKENDEVPYNQI